MEENNDIREYQERLDSLMVVLGQKDEEIAKLKKQSAKRLIESIAPPLTKFVNLGYALADGKTRQEFMETWNMFQRKLIAAGITPLYHAKGEIINEDYQAKIYSVPTPIIGDENKVCRCMKMGFDYGSGGMEEELELYCYDPNAPMPEEEKNYAPAENNNNQDIFAGSGDYPLEYGKDIEVKVDNYKGENIDIIFNSKKIETLFVKRAVNIENPLFYQRAYQSSALGIYRVGKKLDREYTILSPLFSDKPNIRSYRFMLINNVIKLIIYYDGLYYEPAKVIDLAEIPQKD